jgi:hypothetical protein
VSGNFIVDKAKIVADTYKKVTPIVANATKKAVNKTEEFFIDGYEDVIEVAP